MVKMVGAPFFLPVMFRLMGKNWAQMKQIAPTLRYDARVMGGDFEVPTAELERIKVPALAIWGSKATPEMSRPTARSPRRSRARATASWMARRTT